MEFFTIRTKNPESHEEKLKKLAEKYSALRDDIQNTYNGDEEEINKQLGGLDDMFRTLIGSSDQLPLQPLPPAEMYWSHGDAETQKTQEIVKAKEQLRENANSVIEHFNKNMSRHMNAFYESFTKAIQDKDFDAAFSESMALLKSGDTSSYEEISYNDLTKIMDVTRNYAVEYGEEGSTVKYRYPSVDDALNALLDDSEVSEIVRKGVINRLASSDADVVFTLRESIRP